MSNYKYHKNRTEIINNMLEIYGYVFCEHCYRSNSTKFHCHHIIFRSEKPNHENLHHKNNLLLVCNNCHEYLHGDKSTRNELVIDRKLNVLFNDETLCSKSK